MDDDPSRFADSHGGESLRGVIPSDVSRETSSPFAALALLPDAKAGEEAVQDVFNMDTSDQASQ